MKTHIRAWTPLIAVAIAVGIAVAVVACGVPDWVYLDRQGQ